MDKDGAPKEQAAAEITPAAAAEEPPLANSDAAPKVRSSRGTMVAFRGRNAVWRAVLFLWKRERLASSNTCKVWCSEACGRWP